MLVAVGTPARASKNVAVGGENEIGGDAYLGGSCKKNP